MKKLFRNFPQGSPMYIVLHARYRRSRGRRPTVASVIFPNPKNAISLAKYSLLRRGIIRICKQLSPELLAVALKQARLPISVDEAKELIIREREEDGTSKWYRGHEWIV